MTPAIISFTWLSAISSRLLGLEGEDAGGHLLGREADRPPALADQFESEGEDVLEREAVALGVGAVHVGGEKTAGP